MIFVSVRAVKLVQILAARGDEGMVGRERGSGDVVCPAITLFRVAELVEYFADDAEIVQRVRQLRIDRTETSFLLVRGAAQQPFGGGVVARGRRLFRGLDIRSCIVRFHQQPLL